MFRCIYDFWWALFGREGVVRSYVGPFILCVSWLSLGPKKLWVTQSDLFVSNTFLCSSFCVCLHKPVWIHNDKNIVLDKCIIYSHQMKSVRNAISPKSFFCAFTNSVLRITYLAYYHNINRLYFYCGIFKQCPCSSYEYLFLLVKVSVQVVSPRICEVDWLVCIPLMQLTMNHSDVVMGMLVCISL